MRFLQTPDSSLISQVYYDHEASELYVQFRGKDDVYIYSNILAIHVVDFLFAESQGKEFAKNIRNYPTLYPYRKM